MNRVFFSIKDPDPRSFNKSSKQFKKNGIQVKSGILFSEVKNFYRSYFKNKVVGIPFVTAKMAVSNISGKFFTILSTIGTLAKGSNGFGIV